MIITWRLRKLLRLLLFRKFLEERLQSNVDTDIIVVLFVVKSGHGIKGDPGHFLSCKTTSSVSSTTRFFSLFQEFFPALSTDKARLTL